MKKAQPPAGEREDKETVAQVCTASSVHAEEKHGPGLPWGGDIY